MQNDVIAPPVTGNRAWLADVPASLVVFMVALPLCIGIAQACGLPPAAGLITGIVGGILVGSFAGSPLQVSGPAAGLIVLVIQFLDEATAATGDRASGVALLGVAILLCGFLQLLAGSFRLGQWFRAVSPSVVEGMLAGIGITIIAKQFHVMVDDLPPKDNLEGLLSIPQAVWKAFVPPAGSGVNHREAAFIGLVAMLILAGWNSLRPRPLRFLPAAVVAVVAAVLLNEFGRPAVELAGFVLGPAVDDHGGLGVERVSVSANLIGSLRIVGWPGWDVLQMGLIWKAAITFAIIASAETLLCAVAVDSMHTGPRTKFNRELVAQGIGNMVCGSVGGLPMTGVIVRSSANVAAGAKTRLSTILHGFWLLLFVALLPGVLSLIPTSALAAILVYTGWKLVNIPGVRKLWSVSRSEAGIYVATAATIVLADLLTGVVLGIVLSAVKLLLTLSHLRVTRVDEPHGEQTRIELEGAAAFLKLPKLAKTLEGIPQGRTVHIHLEQVRLVDHAMFKLLTEFQRQHEATGGKVILDGNRLHEQFLTAAVAPKEGEGTPPTQEKADGNMRTVKR